VTNLSAPTLAQDTEGARSQESAFVRRSTRDLIAAHSFAQVVSMEDASSLTLSLVVFAWLDGVERLAISPFAWTIAEVMATAFTLVFVSALRDGLVTTVEFPQRSPHLNACTFAAITERAFRASVSAKSVGVPVTAAFEFARMAVATMVSVRSMDFAVVSVDGRARHAALLIVHQTAARLETA